MSHDLVPAGSDARVDVFDTRPLRGALFRAEWLPWRSGLARTPSGPMLGGAGSLDRSRAGGRAR